MKMMHAALVVAMCAGAASVGAQTPPPPPSQEAKTQAAPYVMAAGASDLYEIQSSQIALQKSQNAKIRQFAEKMITDHTKTTADTMKVATRAGLNPTPPALDAGATASIAELQNAAPADFDRIYLGQQIPAHRAAFGLHSFYANAGDNSRLRSNARKVSALVNRHLDMANKIQQGISGG